MRLDWSPFLPHQWEAFTFVAGREEPGMPSISRINCLGGWGTGKSHGAARAAIKFGFLNPWHPGYGDTNPTGIIVAPTFRVLRQATLQQFDSLLPRECVMKRRGPPHNDILMTNGFRWVLYSGEAEIEGLTAAVVWVDEIQHPTFAQGGSRFPNIMARLRDKNALAMAAITSGLPEAGWVRDTLDRPGDPTVKTILSATADNPHVPKSTIKTFYDACPSGSEGHLLGGQWMKPTGLIYVQYDPQVHVLEDQGDPGQRCHMSFDIGNYGAMLFGQERTRHTRNIVGQPGSAKGLHMVDEILTSNDSVDQMCYRAKTETPWIIGRGSTISMDPTSRREEINAVRNHFPEARIVTRDRGDNYHEVESGIRQVQAALMDAHGNARLTFAPKFRGRKHGTLEGLTRYTRNERTGLPIKDNLRDHVLDALRYQVCTVIPLDKPQARVIGGY